MYAEPSPGGTQSAPRKPDAPLSAQAVPRGAPSLAFNGWLAPALGVYSMYRRSITARSTL
jgi:hypothetical protein